MKAHSPFRRLALVTLGIWLWNLQPARGIQVEDLQPGKQWRIGVIEFSGNTKFAADTLRGEMLTKARPWYLFWQDPPLFDPVTFHEDLERIRRFYEARGYYGTQISHDLEVDEEHLRVSAQIHVQEGSVVKVSAVDVHVAGSALLPERLPIKTGDTFSEISYQQAEQDLRQFFSDHGFAYVKTERHADVNLDRDEARVQYDVDPGPPALFGETTVEGLDKIDPAIVLRELTYKAGERFSSSQITASQDKILALNLFSVVRITPKQVQGQPAIVPMVVQVREKEPREINLGVGYGTEERFRARVEWRDNNFFGGGRQVSLAAKYSSIAITGEANLIQPHFLAPANRGILNFRQDRAEEPAFSLIGSRFYPRIERAFTQHLTGFIGYRLEYDRLDRVPGATVRALGGLERQGLLSGPAAGLVWNTANDALNPSAGEIVTVAFNQAGSIWGGRFSMLKVTAEAKKYLSLGWETVLATRLKIGLADSLGSSKNFPLFERFFAGGDNSVRGFGRWRLGPLSAANDPLGGLSLVEGSVELRRPIWGALGGDVFIDFGQVSTRSFDLPIERLKFASGFGFSYKTPVGPLRLDIGFPFHAPPGDRSWQIHFSVGAAF